MRNVLLWLAGCYLAIGLAAALALGCRGRVHERPVQEASDFLDQSKWCVVVDHGKSRIVGCVETVEQCSRYQRQIRRRGRLVGVRGVSACQWVAGGEK